MAPSPTGEYHIGHIRTILYDIAFAKKHKGKFIIRIEDTDRGRYVEGAMDRILDVIKDYGFTWDEGPRVGGSYGPYIQSERLPIYKKYALELVDKKAAYYCFCTTERLEQMREEQKKRGITSPKYDKFCLRLTQEEIEKNLKEEKPYVIRLNVVPDKIITFDDVVFGKISVNSNEIDDQILLKSDGFPTYHLAVVIDDHLMEITHILRGNDWLPSTPKHIILYDAFGWELPTYIHLPNLKELGSTKKLSKRFGPVSAREFLDAGYLPEAMINFLMFLGWNPGTEKEIYSFEEFVKDFDVHKIHKTDLVAFNREKLDWMNGYYIQNMPTEQLLERLKTFYNADEDMQKFFHHNKSYLLSLVELAKTRIKRLKEFKDIVLPSDTPLSDEEKKVAHVLNKEFTKISDWNKDTILAAMRATFKTTSAKGNMLYKILTGRDKGLPLPETLTLFGKEKTLAMLKKHITQ